MSIIDNVKSHPYLSAAVVFVIGAAIVIFFRSSGSNSGGNATGTELYSPDMSSSVAAGTAIQTAQLQANAQSYAQDTALRASQDVNATNLGIAQLAATVQMNGQNVQADTINKQTAGAVEVAHVQYASTDVANQLVATTQQQRDALAAQTTQQSNYLSAQTSQQQSALAAQVRQSELIANVTQAQLVAGAYSHAADVNASLQTTLNAQNQDTQRQLIAANENTTIATLQAQAAAVQQSLKNQQDAQNNAFYLTYQANSGGGFWDRLFG